MNQIINQKAEFYTSIEAQLESAGFIKVDDKYENIIKHQLPGQQISINGQVMHQPGKEVEIKNIVKLNNDGWVSDMDGSNKQEFTQIFFEMIHDGEKIREYNENFYWGELSYFMNIFNQIFRI